jgi:pimeloyl-ACP methyl ester carboxylesterase
MLPLMAEPAHGLPEPVADALAFPVPAETATVEAAGIPFFVRSWGEAGATPVLLLHGVTSSSLGWWRVGPALAAAGFRVHAPDMPGHGRTGSWRGHWGFRDNARDLVMLVDALSISREDLRLVGHSWGAMTAAAFPAVGLAPARLVVLDPPVQPLAGMATMTTDPIERRYESGDEALAAMGAANPTWAYEDVAAKAEALTQFDEAAVGEVLLRNGDWDGGYADLADPSAASVDRWLIRGDPDAGGLIPDAAAARFEALLGDGRVMTISRAPHSPHRTHPAQTVAAILRALRGGRGRRGA